MCESNECPLCGGGPLYQDRFDQQDHIAHCDDCGGIISEGHYFVIMERQNKKNK